MQKPIQRVKFTKAIERHTKIRDQNRSFGYLPRWTSSAQPQRSKIWGSVSGGDRVARARCPRSSVEAGKNVLKWKEHERATFFSPSENRCLPASTLKLEEREFVVDSGASMHMISKKDLSDDEMDTLTKSCSPTIVITANGEVQTHEEATVYVKELVTFLTMKVLENTPAVLSLGKLWDENGYSFGSMIKNHISSKTGFRYSATRRTSFLSWFHACQIRLLDLTYQLQGHFQDRRDIVPRLLQARLHHQQWVVWRLEKERIELKVTSLQWLSTTVDDGSGWSVVDQANKPPKTNQKGPETDRGDPLFSEISEWLQEFKENLVDDEIPQHGDSHAILEPTIKRREDLGKHKTQWWSRTSFWKFWWLDNSRSQGPQWQLRISKQSPKCSRRAGLGHSMGPGVPVQNQNFTRNPEEFAEVLGAR